MKNLYRIAAVTLAFLALAVAANAHVSASTLTYTHSQPIMETREMLPASTKTPTIPPDDDGVLVPTMIGVRASMIPPDVVVTIEPLAGGGTLIVERTTYHYPTYDLVVTRYYAHVPVVPPRTLYGEPAYPGGPPILPAKPLAPV